MRKIVCLIFAMTARFKQDGSAGASLYRVPQGPGRIADVRESHAC
jgi:hypothetical protein